MATIGNAPVFPTQSVLPGNLQVTGNATVSGNATISGTTNSVGNLTENSNNVVNVADTGTITNAMINDGTIEAAKLSGGQSGSAPAFAVRAWVSFNGTGTVAIRASGNVTSISDNGTGSYNVNFTTLPSDGNYAISVVGSKTSGGISSGNSTFGMTREYLGSLNYVQVYTVTSAGAAVDRNYNSVLMIR